MRPLVRAELLNQPFGDPGLYLDFLFRKRALLFDLGDLGSMPPRKLLRVSHAFVSHAHMDHFIGFDHLLRLLLAREWTLELTGPPGFIARVESKLQGYSWNLVRRFPAALMVVASEFHPEGRMHRAVFDCRQEFARIDEASSAVADGILLDEDGLRVRTAVLEHDIPCLAFALEEPHHVNVLKNRLTERGLSVGPWLSELKAAVLRGSPPQTEIRALRSGDGVMRREVSIPLGELSKQVVCVSPGQKIAYVTDVRYHRTNEARIVELARDADMLFIEAVFLDEDAQLAAQRCHLTAAQAGAIARKARAKRLTVFHFSPRYAGREDELRREADRAFKS